MSTVRDFTVIFDAYSQYEESMLAAQMETMESMPEVRTPRVSAGRDDRPRADGGLRGVQRAGDEDELDTVDGPDMLDLRMARLVRGTRAAALVARRSPSL